MRKRKSDELKPRNGHTLVVLIVARISGCISQKEVSNDDQVDHCKEEVGYLYEGEIEFQVVATKGKGEAIDRPELIQIEAMIRSRKLDLLYMEDVGRLVRGAEAVKLWGVAVDNDTRCVAPNDCVDTIDDAWESDLLSACRDHVGHNEHTSKRIKKKLNLRFGRNGGATSLEIAGVIKPEGAKSFDDWVRDDSATEVIQAGAELLLKSLNCAKVARYFNSVHFPVGKYTRSEKWDGKMVRRFYKNTLLKGVATRGNRHSEKHHQTGRRISVPNPNGPIHYECPHLAHLDEQLFDRLNEALKSSNKNFGRKPVDGFDPRWRVPKSATRFPGQHSRCYYCGRHHIWGANGQVDKLMCSGSRDWRCWASAGFSGELLSKYLVNAIRDELFLLNGFEQQYLEMVKSAGGDVNAVLEKQLRSLCKEEQSHAKAEANLLATIQQHGPRDLLGQQLDELEAEKKNLATRRRNLEQSRTRQLEFPCNTAELGNMFDEQFEHLAIDSAEFGDSLGMIVPEIFIYLVRLVDGDGLVPRARVTIRLAGIASDLLQLPDKENVLTREMTFDLFEHPQRERTRKEVVRLRDAGKTQREIVDLIAEHPTITAIQRAYQLDVKMKSLGIQDPYVFVAEPPENSKLKRHLNEEYQFEPLEGYEPKPL